MEKPWDLRERTILFTVSVIRFCRHLPKTREAAEIANQLRRAGGSVGAQYAASRRNKSDKDFISKISGSIEEGDETIYWFDVLARSEITTEEAIRPLRGEANELVAIFVASRSTAIARQQRVKAAKRKTKGTW